ncbi:MAG: hypothetical protein E3K36_00610 [Candidatus Brocadia sp.]|nr:hypothetical protein [Candidatus Brocadia sp.]
MKDGSGFLVKEGSELDKQKATRFDYLDGDFSMSDNKIDGSFSKPRPILDIPYVTSAMAKYYGRRELEKLGDKIGLPKKEDKGKQGKESPIGDILK